MSTRRRTTAQAPQLKRSEKRPELGRVGIGWYRIVINSYKANNNATEKEARAWFKENRIANWWQMAPEKRRSNWRGFREALIQLGWKQRGDRTGPGRTPKSLQAREL